MSLYEFLTSTFNQFIAFFPGPLQFVVTLLVIVGIVGVLVSLVRHHLIFIILIIILLPFLIPILIKLLNQVLLFLNSLLQTVF